MRLSIFASALLVFSLTVGAWAADTTDAKPISPPPSFKLPEVGSEPAPSAFDPAKVAYVLSWIHEQAPDCPAQAATLATEKFLEELSVQSPVAFGQLPGAEFPRRDCESLLLRHLGGQLGGAAQAALRETVARRRIAVLLTAQNGATVSSHEADETFTRIQALSAFNTRRLLEGRIEDDELLRLCKQSREAKGERKEIVVVPAKPQVLTATEIVSEFSRHNQSGAALTKLRAYLLEAQIHNAAGEEQHVFVFKLRPDRFRLVIQQSGASRLVVGFDGTQYWRQLPGKTPQLIPAEAAGAVRDMGEFIDPLFEGEGCSFERGADEVAEGRKCYRVAVTRADGSGYTALIDQENFREVGREMKDGRRIRYSDFRDFAGLTISHREDETSPDGRKGSMEITRMVPNPGLIDAFFTPPAPQELDFFGLERAIAQTPVPAAPNDGKTP